MIVVAAQTVDALNENNRTQLSIRTTDSGGYLRQLDGLRAVAVGGVLWQHWLSSSFHFGSTWGVTGVWLFFVISGYLITGILLGCRNDDGGLMDRMRSIRHFYIRRFLRIFPLYYGTLLVALLLNAPHVRENIAWHALYMTNVFAAVTNEHVPPAAHFWSLAVEEQFYLLWPWLIVFVPRRWLLPTIVLAIAVGPLFRMLAAMNWPDNSKVDLLTPACLDALGIGALLAYLAPPSRTGDSAPAKKAARGMLVVGLPLWIALFLLGRHVHVSWLHVAQPTALALVFGWIVMRAVYGFFSPIGWLLEAPPIVYLGRISYGIYVVHPFIDCALDATLKHFEHPEILDAHGLPRAFVLLTITIAVTSLSWYAFENPLNGLKKRFPYRRSAAPTTPQASERPGQSGGAVDAASRTTQ